MSNEKAVEKIWLAAVKLDNGLIFTGKEHGHIMHTIWKVNGIKEKITQEKQGFVTWDYRFVDRAEAAEIALRAKQISKPVDELRSEMLETLAEIAKPEPSDIIDSLTAENNKLNLILFHRENGLSHPDEEIKSDIWRSRCSELQAELEQVSKESQRWRAEFERYYAESSLLYKISATVKEPQAKTLVQQPKIKRLKKKNQRFRAEKLKEKK
ncbi:MAG: hypothetical protein PHQ00_04960 [Phycisphaerae bacterium]|nr:hypothetical protein [Phycisphaerae bacterium]